jgi:hypothetical protein
MQGPEFESGMPTYSPLKGEFLAVRLKKKGNLFIEIDIKETIFYVISSIYEYFFC